MTPLLTDVIADEVVSKALNQLDTDFKFYNVFI